MYIQPNSDIYILHDVPLDPSYEHTIYFDFDPDDPTAGISAQTSYFISKAKSTHKLSHQSYQRVNKGIIRVSIKAEDLYNCNYLMFRNTSFGSKWFYAFIKSVEYVNNAVSEITYDIDIMQTWHFDYTLGRNFVERAHSLTDHIGENILKENLPTGDFMQKKLSLSYCPFTPGQYRVVIAYGTSKTSSGGLYDCIVDNQFCGVDYEVYSTPSLAYNRLVELNEQNKADAVVAVFQIPVIFTASAPQSSFLATSPGGITIGRISSTGNTTELEDTFTTIGTYTPRNKKLFTSQFYGLAVVASDGDKHEYGFEFFSNPSMPSFTLEPTVTPTPYVTLSPRNYKGVDVNRTEKAVCADFPLCAFATDAYRAWLAQNSGTTAIQLVSGVATAALGIGLMATGAGAPAGAGALAGAATLIGGATSTAQAINTLDKMQRIPDQQHGTAGSAHSYHYNVAGFTIYKYRVTEEYAKVIDDYFTKFGYAVMSMQTPNRRARERWTYIKTIACDITGSIPGDDAKKICEIYDKGITFWANGNDVGHYEKSNNPLVRGVTGDDNVDDTVSDTIIEGGIKNG